MGESVMIEAVTFVCRKEGCPWEGRERSMRLSRVGIGQGLFTLPLVVCECGTVPQRLPGYGPPTNDEAGPEPVRQLLGMDTQGHLYFASGPFPVELHIEGEEPGYPSVVVQVPKLVRRHVGTVVRGIGAGQYHLALPEGEPARG